MKIKSITIHNFRSIKQETILFDDYSLLVGPNNCGKSNIIDALRIFYEKDGFKYNPKVDFPKFKTEDEEAWIEIEFKAMDEEYSNLKESYKSGDNEFKVRKWIKCADSAVKPGIYAYESGNLSNSLFYGPKNIQQGKFGDVIYIPAVSKLDEYTKLTGPTALRDLINHVISKVLEKSNAYSNLKSAFDDFSKLFPKEKSPDDISIGGLQDDIDNELAEWGSKFKVITNSLSPQDLVKYLIDHEILDKCLGAPIPSTSFGQGFQRHLIFALIKLTSKYKDVKVQKDKKEFQPDFNLILFEEPEAFLHPPQQVILGDNLRELSKGETEQVLISTHSSLFVSRNIDDLKKLIKLQREGVETRIYQLTDKDINDIFKNNNEVNKISKSEFDDLDSEGLRYFLWLNSERCSLFFANKILLVEGPSEKIFIEYLLKNKIISLKEKHLYILDSFGKFNIHRFMNLFEKLGVYHSVIFDDDKDVGSHQQFNKLIESSGNKFTIHIEKIGTDFEKFLDINPPSKDYQKPLNVLSQYTKGNIKEEKIKELEEVINKSLS